MRHSGGFNPNTNTIFLVTHGRHVVLYMREWVEAQSARTFMKSQVQNRIQNIFVRLIKYLDGEEISVLQLYSQDGWKEVFNGKRSQCLIHLLVGSQLQETIGHLRRESSAEAQALLNGQRRLLNEVLEDTFFTYPELVDLKMIDLWKKANTLGHAGPEHAPDPDYLGHIDGLPTPSSMSA